MLSIEEQIVAFRKELVAIAPKKSQCHVCLACYGKSGPYVSVLVRKGTAPENVHSERFCNQTAGTRIERWTEIESGSFYFCCDGPVLADAIAAAKDFLRSSFDISPLQ